MDIGKVIEIGERKVEVPQLRPARATPPTPSAPKRVKVPEKA